jgi:mannose-6-phosphate isomerase-like protein (cupin superfamily)
MSVHRYRELMPSRAGGSVVASHIRVGTNGPVPDYVHFHRVQFQIIYCVRGWAKLVYEDGGPPSIMRAGDCVVQPPTIRHRVLESGDGLEVVEVTCPAEHETIADHAMTLPTETPRPVSQRVWHGQRFSWHRCVPHHRRAQVGKGWQAQDLGTAAATGGVGEAVSYVTLFFVLFHFRCLEHSFYFCTCVHNYSTLLVSCTLLCFVSRAVHTRISLVRNHDTDSDTSRVPNRCSCRYTAAGTDAVHSVTPIEPSIVIMYVVSGSVSVEHVNNSSGAAGKKGKRKSTLAVAGDSLSLPPASGAHEAEAATWCIVAKAPSTEILVVTLPVARLE